MSTEHTVDATQVHHDWDNSREPAVVVQSGDVVHFDLPMTGQGQVSKTSKSGEVVWDFDTIYNLGGPVYVEGAKPGQTLEIEILALEPGPWGWTTVIPELGLLSDDFPEPYLKIFDLRNRSTATVAPGVEVPIGPFLGTMGVHTDEPGQHSPFPPHKGAGNVDNRHLIAGSTLWIPIWCEARSSPAGMPTPRRETARSASRGSSARCMPRSASTSSSAHCPCPGSGRRAPSSQTGRTTARWASTPI
jgi:acetamidase/formamidase